MEVKSGVDKFLFYTTPDGSVKLEVFLEDETVWLTQKKMGELFGVDVRTISEHIKNVFSDNELVEDSVVRKFRITALDGKTYLTKFYNLDVIIAVGYRVNSLRATQFRMWANQVLKEFIVKGFVLNNDRLKQGEKYFGKDYFNELLEKVRSIRASERRIYLQITDIFAECSTDYDPRSETTKEFFATVQNKFHYAITGKTAAEIILENASKDVVNMGLKTWKNAPKGRVLTSDVTVAKNYLKLEEIKKMERTISGFFDYVENIIENKKTFTMEEFVGSVEKFLSFNEYRILSGKGEVTKELADSKAKTEYKEFNKTQLIDSDFENMIRGIEKSKKGDS